MFRFTALACFLAVALASSHSEAPGTSTKPNADISDFYMFKSYESSRMNQDYVTFLMNTHPLQAPQGGPNYYALSDEHFYEIYIDKNADGVEDITFQFLPGARLGGEIGEVTVPGEPFSYECCAKGQNCADQTLNIHKGIELQIGDESVAVPLKFVGPLGVGNNAALNFHEYYSMWRIDGDRDLRDDTSRRSVTWGDENSRFTIPFQYAGEKTFGSDEKYEAYARQYVYDIKIPGCEIPGKVFVGQRKESFAIDLGRIFDLVNMVPIPGFPGGVTECRANDDITSNNVNTFALEIATSCLVGEGEETVIAAWGGVRDAEHGELETNADGTINKDNHIAGRQVSRLGNPLVNELVIGLKDKDVFSRSRPAQDASNGFAPYVLNPTLPEIINILFGDDVRGLVPTITGSLAPLTPRLDLVNTFLFGIEGVNKPETADVPFEAMRLNTASMPVARAAQDRLGVINGDGAGYPNGRRPGDDTVDISLMVVMGKLRTLGLPEDITGGPSKSAPIGGVPLSDGALMDATDFDDHFPYLRTPNPGARTDSTPGSCPRHLVQQKACPTCTARACNGNTKDIPAESSSFTHPVGMSVGDDPGCVFPDYYDTI